jgi:hypothetical protein
MATMNKEEQNNYVFHVPHWLWHFVPHCFITPQHILKKPGKKDCQIFDTSWTYNWDSIPVNSMTSTPNGFGLKCEFGSPIASSPLGTSSKSLARRIARSLITNGHTIGIPSPLTQ